MKKGKCPKCGYIMQEVAPYLWVCDDGKIVHVFEGSPSDPVMSYREGWAIEALGRELLAAREEKENKENNAFLSTEEDDELSDLLVEVADAGGEIVSAGEWGVGRYSATKQLDKAKQAVVEWVIDLLKEKLSCEQ